MTPSLDSSPRLNFDIFCVVYGFLSRRRASVLMKTCRILYQTGIPHLLDQYRPFPPCISTIRQLESFCKFMLAQTFRSNRIRAFNSLEVSVAFLRGDEEHDMVADQLAQVLNQGCYLKDLRLLEAETYFRVSQLTVMSLSNLPELTTLQIAEIGRRSMKAFKEMKSPISSLDIGYPLIGEFNLLPDLHDVASTLTELYVGYYALSSMSKVFPYMRDLHLESYFSAENVEVLVHVFPNLSNLSLNGELDLLQTENVDDVRQRNRKSMNQLSNQWRSLEYLHGDVAVVYSLGLTCQVRELSIGTVDEVNLQWTLALLVDLRPQILNIDARCRTSPDTLLQPLFDQASSTCRSLTIHFDVDNIQMPILDILVCVST